MNWTEKDLAQFKSKGIDTKLINKQIEGFKAGFPFMDIKKAATVGDGLIRLSDEEIKKYIRKYNYESTKLKILKFVPASGAASRMFKALFELKGMEPNSAEFDTEMAKTDFNSPANFINNLKKFAFYTDLKNTPILRGEEISQTTDYEYVQDILTALLDKKGLNYGNKPKGLLKFHQYPDGTGTPTREHLVEGTLYASGGNDVFIHFTVSPEHIEDFKNHVEELKPILEERFAISYYISFSVQKSATDTIAVDMENKAFRNEDGSLLFRPAGHGALIENLNELNADIIFVKNIDNVVPDRLKTETINYKKALAGVLLDYREKTNGYIEKLASEQNADNKLIDEIIDFLKNKLCLIPDIDFDEMNSSEKQKYLIKKLNRPFRVCGMVKNEGEPGGGPFWTKNNDGSTSLQIVEGAQIDLKDTEKQKIIESASHFNPVDLICAVKDHKGKKFDLTKYVDASTGFISEKSKNGKTLKAMELPGLWNGAMSDWNTLFVEVPIITFNPVKVINDLLRPEHQIKA